MMPYVAARSRTVKTVEDLMAYNAGEGPRRIPSGQGLLELLAPASAGLSAGDYAVLAARLRRASTDILEATFKKTGADMLVSFGTAHSELYATAGYPATPLAAVIRMSSSACRPFIGKAGDDAKLLAYARLRSDEPARAADYP
jgi:hypothetical protein